MRALVTKDVIAALRLVNKIDLFHLLEEAKKDVTNDNAEEKAKELILSLLINATDPVCEKALYAFLAGPFEMTAEEVENLKLDKLADCIAQTVELSDVKSFFTSAARLKGLL